MFILAAGYAMLGIWRLSVVADLAFTAGWTAFRAAERSLALGLVAGAAMTSAVHLASLLLLPHVMPFDGFVFDEGDTIDNRPLDHAVENVLTWGWGGIAFSALAPTLLAWWARRRQAKDPAPKGA